MRSEEYLSYLQSEKWREIARKRAEIDNFRCCMCGSKGTRNNPLQVHHLAYHHLGNEDVWRDVLTLCKSCHQGVHVMMNRRTAENRHGWKDDVKVSNHVLDIDC